METKPQNASLSISIQMVAQAPASLWLQPPSDLCPLIHHGMLPQAGGGGWTMPGLCTADPTSGPEACPGSEPLSLHSTGTVVPGDTLRAALGCDVGESGRHRPSSRMAPRPLRASKPSCLVLQPHPGLLGSPPEDRLVPFRGSTLVPLWGKTCSSGHPACLVPGR